MREGVNNFASSEEFVGEFGFGKLAEHVIAGELLGGHAAGHLMQNWFAFKAVNGYLARKGLLLKQGSIVDASIERYFQENMDEKIGNIAEDEFQYWRKQARQGKSR